MHELPTVIRRCDPQIWLRGQIYLITKLLIVSKSSYERYFSLIINYFTDESYIELEKFKQNWYFDEKAFNETCVENCQNPKYQNYKVQNGSITSCVEIKKPFTICYSVSVYTLIDCLVYRKFINNQKLFLSQSTKSSRAIQWIKTSKYDYYGHYSYCNNFEHYDEIPLATGKQCLGCMCEVVQPHKITISAQTSRIDLNMLVSVFYVD